MTKRIAVVAIIAMLIAGVAIAADNTGFGVGKTRNVTFNNDVKVGDKTLTAGEYKVLHLMEGSEHTLVFKGLNNVEKVRVKCNMVQLTKKAEDTQSEYRKVGSDQILVALTFRGDTFKHTF